MKNYEHIFFDFDGTLMDTSQGIYESFDFALKSFEIEPPDHSEYDKMIGPPLVYSFMTWFGFDEQKARLGMKRYRDYYTPVGMYHLKVYNGIPELLKKLYDGGKKLYVATSKPERFAKELLEKYSLEKYFTLIAGADIDETRVTKVQIINYALETSGITEKSSVLMIGDRLYDANGAKEAGIDCQGVLWGFGSEQELLDAGCIGTSETPMDLGNEILSGC